MWGVSHGKEESAGLATCGHEIFNSLMVTVKSLITLIFGLITSNNVTDTDSFFFLSHLKKYNSLPTRPLINVSVTIIGFEFNK
jgi:hypothetical protein